MLPRAVVGVGCRGDGKRRHDESTRTSKSADATKFSISRPWWDYDEVAFSECEIASVECERCLSRRAESMKNIASPSVLCRRCEVVGNDDLSLCYY